MAPKSRVADMRAGVYLLPVLLLALGLAQGQAAPVGLQRSISSSGQFVVYFADGMARTKFARQAEDIKEKWRRILHLKDDWKAPIIIQVAARRPRNAPQMVTRLYESDGGEFKVQIDIYDLAVLNSRALDREILRALCLEYSYRGHPALAGRPIVQPPEWLIDGMAEDIVASEEGIPSGLYEMLIKSGPPPQLSAFLKMRPERLDATSRTLYSAQAMGLLQALLGLAGGADGLADYLSGLPAGNPTDARELLDGFPEFSGDASQLSKVWTLSLAGASAADRVKPLTMQETRRQLALLLEISVPK